MSRSPLGAVRGLVRARGPRLGYVLGAYPQLSETFVLDELRELCRQGAHPGVVAMFAGDGDLGGAPPAFYLTDPSRLRRIWSGVRLVARHPLRTLLALGRSDRNLGAGPGEMLALAPAVHRLRTVEHLHAHFAADPTTYAARLAALTGATFSFTAHAYDIHMVQDRLDEKLRRARFVLTPTEYNRSVLVGRSAAVANVVHHRNGIHVERFRRRSAYRPSGPLVAVGRLVPKKGFDVAIKALARTGRHVPPLQLAGHGPEEEHLRALAADLGVDVRFLGPLPHRDVPRLLEGASALILPCVPLENGDRDAAPTVLLEAMALELPVITSAMDGVEELVAPDRGMLATPGDPIDLGRAIDQLYARNDVERSAMGAAGRAYVAQYHDLTRQVECLRLLFSSAGAD